MIKGDNLDKFLLFRRVQLNRADILNVSHCLYCLILLRKYKGLNILGISFHLRKFKRTSPLKLISVSLQSLITAGYVRQNSRGSLYYITEAGLQALKDFNNAIECADYVNYNKKAPISKVVKRPGI